MPLTSQRRPSIVVLLVTYLSVSGLGQNSINKGSTYFDDQVTIPSRPAVALFKSKPGKQQTEIYYEPATHRVTLKLLVQDPRGYFIPDLHPANFAVYENGVRQRNVQVSVEHTPVMLGLLIEYGGRILPVNKLLGGDVINAAGQLLSSLDPADRVLAWTYNDTVHKLNDAPEDPKTLGTELLMLQSPGFSEADLYDSLLFVSGQMKMCPARKGIVVISSGINTFSKATYQEVLANVARSGCPVYVLGLTTILRDYSETHNEVGSVGAVVWKKAERELEEIATASGGRAYFPDSTIDLATIYSDMMENLKVRYVVTYQSSTGGDLNTPRTVRVELIDPATGKPLRIVDSSGRPVEARVIVQDTYVPAQASQGRTQSTN